MEHGRVVDGCRFKYGIVIWQEVIDGKPWWIATVPDLPGCCADGETIEECLDMLEDAISAWIQATEERGEFEVPEPSDPNWWVVVPEHYFKNRAHRIRVNRAISESKPIVIDVADES